MTLKAKVWMENAVAGFTPDEFTLLEFLGDDAKRYGYVTFDWKSRGFRIGLSWNGPVSPGMKYKGRGWQEKLRDAGKRSLLEAYDAEDDTPR